MMYSAVMNLGVGGGSGGCRLDDDGGGGAIFSFWPDSGDEPSVDFLSSSKLSGFIDLNLVEAVCSERLSSRMVQVGFGEQCSWGMCV